MTTAKVRPKDLLAGDEIEDAVDASTFGDDKYLRGLVRRHPDGRRRTRRYSRDLRAALDMLTSWFAPYTCDYYDFTRMPTSDVPSMGWSKDAHWTCTVEGMTWRGLQAQREEAAAKGEPLRRPYLDAASSGFYHCEGEAETLPLAICRAMLDVAEDER
jgi:hypothetical protein